MPTPDRGGKLGQSAGILGRESGGFSFPALLPPPCCRLTSPRIGASLPMLCSRRADVRNVPIVSNRFMVPVQ